MVTADELILEWDTFLTSLGNLWEIERAAIQTITWSTNGISSPPETIGTKMQRPMAGFEHVIQPDGTLLAEEQWKERQQSTILDKFFAHDDTFLARCSS